MLVENVNYATDLIAQVACYAILLENCKWSYVIYVNSSNIHVPNIFKLGKLKMITIYSTVHGQHVNLKPSTESHSQCDLCRSETVTLSKYLT
jgi:hypothetical protein